MPKVTLVRRIAPGRIREGEYEVTFGEGRNGDPYLDNNRPQKVASRPMHLNPISSWTISPREAVTFSNYGSEREHGFTLSAKIPASRVWSLSASTGPGALHERELLVLSGDKPDRATIRWVDGRWPGTVVTMPQATLDHLIPEVLDPKLIPEQERQMSSLNDWMDSLYNRTTYTNDQTGNKKVTQTVTVTKAGRPTGIRPDHRVDHADWPKVKGEPDVDLTGAPITPSLARTEFAKMSPAPADVHVGGSSSAATPPLARRRRRSLAQKLRARLGMPVAKFNPNHDDLGRFTFSRAGLASHIAETLPPQPNHYYRVVSEDDYQRMLKAGRVDTAGTHNTELTERGAHGMAASNHPELQYVQGPSRVLHLRTEPGEVEHFNPWDVAITKPLPLDRIVGTSGLITPAGVNTGAYTVIVDPVRKFNPNHDRLGRFSFSDAADRYVPDENAHPAGEFVAMNPNANEDRFEDKQYRWRQKHSELVRAAMHHWKGDPTNLHSFMRWSEMEEPLPGSGSGKRYRAMAEALRWELENKAKVRNRVLYRGVSGRPLPTVGETLSMRAVGFSSNKGTGRKYAGPHSTVNSTPIVYVLDKGARSLRIKDYDESDFDAMEQEHIVGGDFKVTGVEAPTATSAPYLVHIRQLDRVIKFNPNHEPAGSPKGGEFAPARISAPVSPDTKTRHRDPYELRRVSIEAYGANAKVAADKVVKRVAGFEDLAGPDSVKKVITRMTEHIVDTVERSIKESRSLTDLHAEWYPIVKHVIAPAWAKEFHTSECGVIGALAALSPGADWRNNMRWAHFVLESVHDKSFVVEQSDVTAWAAARRATYRLQMIEWQKGKRESEPAVPKPPKWREMIGKPLSELDDHTAAEVIKARSEAIGKLSQFDGPAMAKKLHADPRLGLSFGDPNALASANTTKFIERAVTIARHPTIPAIDKALGTNAKIRSFFNNMSDPLDTKYEDTTNDSHHTGMALGLPIGLSHPLISTARGGAALLTTPSSAATGMRGIHPLVTEATRRAAKIINRRHGTHWRPNQIQSIAWEQWRSEWLVKSKKALASVMSARSRYAKGEISKAEMNKLVEDARLAANNRPRGQIFDPLPQMAPRKKRPKVYRKVG
jgi:hypothetical protein